ncbi:MAG: 6-phosphogluconolactonase [Woeseiaceae bacterium]
MHKWFVYDEFDAASKAAADFLTKTIETCIALNGMCHVALPGGNSPARCLSYLAEKELPWQKVHWYLGDERCYPKNHVERNDVMLDKKLWSLIGKTNIHHIPTELGVEKAAEIYREVISVVDRFDVVFLGMGEDGHTASLFPGNAALDDLRSVVPVYHSPKPPSERVSLSIGTLRKAQYRMVLTCGASKAAVIKQIKEGDTFPINCLGDINWFIDKEALLDSAI